MILRSPGFHISVAAVLALYLQSRGAVVAFVGHAQRPISPRSQVLRFVAGQGNADFEQSMRLEQIKKELESLGVSAEKVMEAALQKARDIVAQNPPKETSEKTPFYGDINGKATEMITEDMAMQAYELALNQSLAEARVNSQLTHPSSSTEHEDEDDDDTVYAEVELLTEEEMRIFKLYGPGGTKQHPYQEHQWWKKKDYSEYPDMDDGSPDDFMGPKDKHNAWWKAPNYDRYRDASSPSIPRPNFHQQAPSQSTDKQGRWWSAHSDQYADMKADEVPHANQYTDLNAEEIPHANGNTHNGNQPHQSYQDQQQDFSGNYNVGGYQQAYQSQQEVPHANGNTNDGNQPHHSYQDQQPHFGDNYNDTPVSHANGNTRNGNQPHQSYQEQKQHFSGNYNVGDYQQAYQSQREQSYQSQQPVTSNHVDRQQQSYQNQQEYSYQDQQPSRSNHVDQWQQGYQAPQPRSHRNQESVSSTHIERRQHAHQPHSYSERDPTSSNHIDHHPQRNQYTNMEGIPIKEDGSPQKPPVKKWWNQPLHEPKNNNSRKRNGRGNSAPRSNHNRRQQERWWKNGGHENTDYGDDTTTSRARATATPYRTFTNVHKPKQGPKWWKGGVNWSNSWEGSDGLTDDGFSYWRGKMP